MKRLLLLLNLIVFTPNIYAVFENYPETAWTSAVMNTDGAYTTGVSSIFTNPAGLTNSGVVNLEFLYTQLYSLTDLTTCGLGLT